MLPEERKYLLKQAKEECIESVCAVFELGQISDPNLKVEQGLCFWTLSKRGERNKQGSAEEFTEVSEKKTCQLLSASCYLLYSAF